MKTYKKIDPLTQKVFLTTSSIKKFETKENQIMFNNRKRYRAKKKKAFVDDLINHNYDVLQTKLGHNDEIIVSVEELKEIGFNFGVITHYKNIKERAYLCVYEYCYIQEANNQIKINRNGKNHLT